MDISIPLTANDAFWALTGFSLAGWNLWLQLKWKSADTRVDSAKKEMKAAIETMSTTVKAEISAQKIELDGKIALQQVEIERLKLEIERQRIKLEIVEHEYLSRTDHKEFRQEILALVKSMNSELTQAIEKLSNRLERFTDRRPLTHLREEGVEVQ